jgi:Na+-transporting NADH:ubiquinone oxidoreductase subunit NqrE
VPLTVTISHAVDVAHGLSLAVVVSLSIRTVMEWHVVTLRVEQRCRTARPDTNRTTA